MTVARAKFWDVPELPVFQADSTVVSVSALNERPLDHFHGRGDIAPL